MNADHEHAPERRHPPRRLRTLAALAACAAAAWVVTGFYSVRANERAIVRRCGKALAQLRLPGLHFGFPYGIDRVTRVNVLEVKRVGVGAGLAERALGRQAEPQKAECLTGDRNLIVVSAIVQYRIADPRAALFAVADVPTLVRDVAASALSEVIAGMNVDDVLTVQRDAIRHEVRRAAQATLDRYGAGIEVREVLLPAEGVAAPQEVAEAFRDVNSARVDRERAVNEAEGYTERLLPRARGEARGMVAEAEGFAQEVVKKARGDANRFRQVADEFAKGREVTTRRLILETMEEVLPRLNKVVVGEGKGTPLDLGLIEAKE